MAMEKSTNSFTKQSLSYKEEGGISNIDDSSPEESQSGWTVYFEDFLSNGRENSFSSNNNSLSSGFGSSSMVSDAASCAAWKLLGKSSDQVKSFKNLSFKKRRTKVVDDDSLEDTASSPVNSPKVSDLKQFQMSPRRRFENVDNIPNQEKRNSGTSSDHGLIDLQTTTDQRNHEMECCSGKGNHCSQLKKRGLCLVPLSMLINYLG